MDDDLPQTIPRLFQATVKRSADQLALGMIANGKLHWQTWSDLDLLVRTAARRLRDTGVEKGDRVAQWEPNDALWIVTDLATALLGAVHVPLHASLSGMQVKELIHRCEPKLLVRRGGAYAPSLKDISCPEFKYIDLEREHLTFDVPPLDWSEFQEVGVVGNDLATLLFTSGTTGQPRGVMLSHENLVSNSISVSEAVGSDAEETRLCFLPLSHIYARTCDLYSWLYRGSRLVLAENRDTIVRDCQLVKPSVINGVPYFYQKVAQQLRGAEPGALKALLGGNLKRCFCGGAAVAPEVEALFEQQGVPLLSGYGLTEASPVISATAAEDYRAGTVGRPLGNVEVKLSDQKEILARGPSIMMGYWKNQTATEEAIIDGWLHTGDLGEIDDVGHLRITGRKKDLIVLSTGKNISPTSVEQCLAGSPLVEHACVVGEGRKCLGALIVPNPDALRAEIRARRLWVWSRRRAVTHPKIRELFRQEIDRLLASLSAEQQVGPFAILDRNFSVERDELTTKLSLRRATIATNFARQIERMYAR